MVLSKPGSGAGRKILALTKYTRMGASTRVRMMQYAPLLRDAGIEVEFSPLFDDAYLTEFYSGGKRRLIKVLGLYLKRILKLSAMRSYDMVWLEGEMLPFLPAWIERLAAAAGVDLVADYDDAVFHRYDLHKSGLVRLLLGRKIDAVMRCARVVVAGNGYLADRARSAGAKRIEVIPTVIDFSRVAAHAGRPASPPVQASDRVRIGWIGNPGTRNYLDRIFPALERLSASLPLKLVCIGSGPIDRPGIPIEVLPWTEATEMRDLASFDIGIMPLPDEPFERGKCGYKILQYMSCGVPVVASPVGVNAAIIDHGRDGYLAGDSAEWYACLKSLAEDGKLRATFGERARGKTEAGYSLRAHGPRLAAILAGLA